ncbi:unnamed protein product [Meganyctiphanes norvegica]|uniref:Uncharacterized protein n=1 Tax=Meganyctiphanes norvegica TaxID=48144 RepID=A0AAV2RL09_MEGNR
MRHLLIFLVIFTVLPKYILSAIPPRTWTLCGSGASGGRCNSQAESALDYPELRHNVHRPRKSRSPIWVGYTGTAAQALRKKWPKKRPRPKPERRPTSDGGRGFAGAIGQGIAGGAAGAVTGAIVDGLFNGNNGNDEKVLQDPNYINDLPTMRKRPKRPKRPRPKPKPEQRPTSTNEDSEADPSTGSGFASTLIQGIITTAAGEATAALVDGLINGNNDNGEQVSEDPDYINDLPTMRKRKRPRPKPERRPTSNEGPGFASTLGQGIAEGAAGAVTGAIVDGLFNGNNGTGEQVLQDPDYNNDLPTMRKSKKPRRPSKVPGALKNVGENVLNGLTTGVGEATGNAITAWFLGLFG